MADEFLSYGQAAPMAVRFNQADNMEDLRQLDMNMQLGHIERADKAFAEKENEMNVIGSSIAEAVHTMRNSTFLNKSSMDRVREEFGETLTGVKSLYSIPTTNRDIAWYAQAHNLSKSLNSQLINNDIENKTLYDQAQAMYQENKITETEHERWLNDFRSVAAEGESYKKRATSEGRNYLPTLAQESMAAKGSGIIKSIEANFSALDYNPIKSDTGELIGYKLKDEIWDKFVNEVLINSVWNEAERAFMNLSADIQNQYLSNLDIKDRKSVDKAIKNYIRREFKPYQPGDNYLGSIFQRNIQSTGSGERDPYEMWAMPVLKEFDEMGDEEKRDRTMNYAGAFLPANIDNTNTSLNVPLTSHTGQILNIEFQIPEGISANTHFTNINQISSSRRVTMQKGEKKAKQGADGLMELAGGDNFMSVNDVPLSFNEQTLTNIFMNLPHQDKVTVGYEKDKKTNKQVPIYADNISFKKGEGRLGAVTELLVISVRGEEYMYDMVSLKKSFLEQTTSINFMDEIMGGFTKQQTYVLKGNVSVDPNTIGRSEFNWKVAGEQKGTAQAIKLAQ